MANFNNWYEIATRLRRWRSTAVSWSDKFTAFVESEASSGDMNETQQWLFGYEAYNYLIKVLDNVDSLSALLTDEDQINEVAEKANHLNHRLRALRLQFKLTNVEGRMPEEAKAYLDKANSLIKE